jgi:hypothetical protein
VSEARVDQLEDRLRRIDETLARLEPLIIRIDATLPHLATKAELTAGLARLETELATKPSRSYLWVVFTALIAAYAAGIAALAVARGDGPVPGSGNRSVAVLNHIQIVEFFKFTSKSRPAF